MFEVTKVARLSFLMHVMLLAQFPSIFGPGSIPLPALRWGVFACDAGAVPHPPAPPPLPGVPTVPDVAEI